MTIAIIIARGGSKRLPRKNVRAFCGHPLVAWAITQARCSHLVDMVFLSTDDDEIAEIAQQYGASVIRRPDWPDADQASGTRPMAHGVQTCMDLFGSEFDTLVCMLPTKPLVRPEDIDNTIRAYREFGCDNVAPLRPGRQVIVFKRLNKNRARNVIFNKNYDYLIDGLGFNVSSPRWYMNYFMKAQVEMAGDDTDKSADKAAAIGGGDSYYIPCEYWQYADVDTADEFEFAELLMDHYILKGRGMKVYEEYAMKNAMSDHAGNLAQQ